MTTRATVCAVSAMGLWLGCGSTATTKPAPAEPYLQPLDAPRLARRMRLDLHGVLPTVDELNAVETRPGSLAGLRDSWMDSPRYEARLVDIFAEKWQTRIDLFHVFWTEYEALDDRGDTIEYAFERSVSDEPLRLMAHLAATDAPWTDIVNADYTMANALLEDIWPLERDAEAGDDGWTVAYYTDGRPPVGILATNGLWWRYHTTATNGNRARAAMMMKMLACDDIQALPVTFTEAPSLVDGASIEDALKEDPYCIGCHTTVDPIASALFGFWSSNEHSATENHAYHPERELLGEQYLGVTPAWYGQPLYGLTELGPTIAEDFRFDRCAATSMTESLLRRRMETEDADLVEGLTEDFVRGDRRMRVLMAAITDTDEYRAGGLREDAPADEPAVPIRLLSPDQLHSLLADVAGWTWTEVGFEQLRNDTWGYRVLLGGVDGVYLSSAPTSPGVTWAATTWRVAESVGLHLASGADAPITAGLDLSGPPTPSDLNALVWRLHARRLDSTERTALADLWTSVHALEGAELAWAALFTALLRDPSFLTY